MRKHTRAHTQDARAHTRLLQMSVWGQLVGDVRPPARPRDNLLVGTWSRILGTLIKGRFLVVAVEPLSSFPSAIRCAAVRSRLSNMKVDPETTYSFILNHKDE